MKPGFGLMIPGDCEECESEDVDVRMDSPSAGVVTCRSCGHVERFEAARMETFDEMLNSARIA